MDKSGSFIGYMFVQTEQGLCNMSVALVENGLASVHFTAEKGGYYSQLRVAEEKAKKVPFSFSVQTCKSKGMKLRSYHCLTSSWFSKLF